MTRNGAGTTRTWAGLLVFLAGAGTLMGIITAEAIYPGGYTTGGSQISDLGGTEPPGSIVVRPVATIFDLTMVAAGILNLAAAVLLSRTSAPRAPVIVLGLFGLGTLGVGIFPGNTGAPHQLFALLTFLSGGLAGILSQSLVRGPMRVVVIVLGSIALVNLVGYTVLKDGWFVMGLGIGGLERWVAYPIVIWLICLGGHLMAPADDRWPTGRVPQQRCAEPLHADRPRVRLSRWE